MLFQVPLNYVNKIKDQREFHRGSWQSVVDTVGINEELKDFDFVEGQLEGLF